MESNSEWFCGTCYGSQSSADSRMVITYWWNIIDQTSKYDIKLLLQLLQKTMQVFDKNDYYNLEVKRRIIENIGDSKENSYETLAEAWLEKKVEFCIDHLNIQRVVSPGLSEYRAYISSHIAEPLYWLSKKRYLAHKDSAEELRKNMEDVAEHLLMVIQVWGLCRKRSEERLKAEHARNLLVQVDDKYLHRNLLDVADDILVNNSIKS